MNKPTPISQRILQAHCQSRTSQRYNQSFVKELAKPTHKRLTAKTEEEHRTDNSGFAKKRVQWLIEHSTSHPLFRIMSMAVSFKGFKHISLNYLSVIFYDS
jgi:hypothetical protein